jgi:hypothetical protein
MGGILILKTRQFTFSDGWLFLSEIQGVVAFVIPDLFLFPGASETHLILRVAMFAIFLLSFPYTRG